MRYADYILLSNTVFDSVKDEPFAGGVVIVDDKIEYVGSKNAAMKYAGANTVVKDFGDKLIMPGFCDGHAHIQGAATSFCALRVTGLGDCLSEEEAVQCVVKFAEEHPNEDHYYGMGWSLNSWGAGAAVPTAASLDKYFPDKPVILTAYDGHTNWLNTAAIEACGMEGYLAENPEISPELAPRDENGKLIGYFREHASHHATRFTKKSTPEGYLQQIRDLVKMANKYGLTGLTDCSPTAPEDLGWFVNPMKVMENKGELTLRIHMWPGCLAKTNDFLEDPAKFCPYTEVYNTDMLHISGLKIVLDGITENHTAYMLEPYFSDPSEQGFMNTKPEVFIPWVEKANSLGFGVKVHAIGDGTVRTVIDAYDNSAKKNGASNVRNNIEHMENLSEEDLPRLGKLGIVASIQPAHMPIAKGFAEKNLGLEHFKHEFRYRDMITNGAVISIGTDAPVVFFNPFENIYSGVTREDFDGAQDSPYTVDQVLTLAEVLKGYTYGAAYASGYEHKVGTLEPGKYADIVVWNENPFAIDPHGIKDCSAVCTISNGKIVYEA